MVEISSSDARVIVVALRSRALRMTQAAAQAAHPAGATVALEAAERCRRLADTVGLAAQGTAVQGPAARPDSPPAREGAVV
ncbi:hypothetical protein BJY14_001564 [Actinomadura luteofluorescens]|uniref:Uncharacterized protein n=1 Tax=Actinomadura luteofluorescens TaxID=46163 RepID=A0A7Y9ED73_9ACTN|nr:hypothetical protein [Actinomadura luteofluorescens]NYD45581.1 hypothetical protein [Actinomadura luteofluorescens]